MHTYTFFPLCPALENGRSRTNCDSPLKCLALAMYNPALISALATQDILKTEVDAAAVNRATLGLGNSPWYSLSFGYRSSRAPCPDRQQVCPALYYLLPYLCMSMRASCQPGLSAVQR